MEIQYSNTLLNANKLFIICAQEDKDYVVALQKQLKSRKLPVWSMFQDDGNFSVEKGENHLQVAITELKRACVVLLLISENSIQKGADSSSFIYSEISNFYSLTKDCTVYQRKLLPICIGEDYFNRLPESWMPLGINSFKISSLLKKKNTPNGNEIDEKILNQICVDISIGYFECMNSNYKYIIENKFQLAALGNRLMQSSNAVVRTISDDIRSGDENDNYSLSAIHLITNEISEYDCNAYSLMIISANLLGTPRDGYYHPRENGVKYYYYCPQKYLESLKEDYTNRIISFLRRDDEAITYAENSIRAHYVVSKKIISYLYETFHNKSATSILLSFSVPETKKDEFTELLEEYDGIFYDSDSECIDLPRSFFEWLFGKDVKFNVNIFEFIKKVTSFLNAAEVGNVTMLTELLGVEKMLSRIYDFHTYMHNKNSELPYNKFCNIAKKVIGLKGDQNNALIERWCIDRHHSNEWELQDIDEVINEAIQNVEFIPIKDTDDFVPCNSFVVYDHRDRSTGKRHKELVWYSTAHNFVQTAEKVSVNDEREMLVVLNEKTTEQDCDIVRNTLKYLKDIGLIEKYHEF